MLGLHFRQLCNYLFLFQQKNISERDISLKLAEFKLGLISTAVKMSSDGSMSAAVQLTNCMLDDKRQAIQKATPRYWLMFVHMKCPHSGCLCILSVPSSSELNFLCFTFYLVFYYKMIHLLCGTEARWVLFAHLERRSQTRRLNNKFVGAFITWLGAGYILKRIQENWNLRTVIYLGSYIIFVLFNILKPLLCTSANRAIYHTERTRVEFNVEWLHGTRYNWYFPSVPFLIKL